MGITVDIIDIDWQQLPPAQFDALLVVENLDCFYQLHAFTLALSYQQPLIVYRGDKPYSKGCKALKDAWLGLNKPAFYFGDFDAKGVSIALNEGYSANAGDSKREFVSQAFGFGASAGTGALVAWGTRSIGMALMLTPLGWKVLIGAAIVGGFMAASYADNDFQDRAGRIYDRISGRK